MKSVIADYRYRVLCLRIVPVTGSAIYLTHHVHDLTMGGHTYLSTSGYDFTGYTAGSDMSAAAVELQGIAGVAGIGIDEIRSGLFDGARGYLFATTWTNPVEDEEPITASILGKTTLVDDKYTIEDMALIDLLGQSVGKSYTAACSRRFGDAGCGKSLASLTVTGVLSSATSHSVVTVAEHSQADDYFAAGTLRFTSGENAGLAPLTVKSYVGNVIETYEPFYHLPQAGDAYELVPGCRKRLADCRDKWNNVLNFFGFTYIPLGSQYAQAGTR